MISFKKNRTDEPAFMAVVVIRYFPGQLARGEGGTPHLLRHMGGG